MKKIVLTVVAMMAVTFSFAGTNAKNVDKKYDMSCDIYRLSTVLDLDDRQMDAVEEIQEQFSNEMQSLASVRGPKQRHMIHEAVRKDASQMRRVLNDKQFGAYMRILFNTLRNRQL
jgi:hypothetical protein